MSSDINKKELKVVGGYSALHHACLEGFEDAVKLLVEAGADVNIKADNIPGEAPLHICCKLDRRICGKILIDHGANIDARDNFGNNPAFWANSKQNFDLIKFLGLPTAKAATAQEFLALAIQRNPLYQLPSLHKKKKKGKGGDKKGGKKGKK